MATCSRCHNPSHRCCCGKKCPIGPTGPTGPSGGGGGSTGPTGPTGPAVNMQLLGVKQVALPPDNPGLVTLTPTDLINATHPTARYFGLQFTGGTSEATVSIVLPKPATLDDAYFIDIENVSNGVAVIVETENPPTGNTVTLTLPGSGSFGELTWRNATNAAIASTVAQEYRTKVQVRPDGVWQVPGYTNASAPG